MGIRLFISVEDIGLAVVVLGVGRFFDGEVFFIFDFERWGLGK